jgi:glycosyltransferase involved in cell wall biosynthesis
LEPRVLIVVPTLGRRPEMLRKALTSIRSQSVTARIVIVGPLHLDLLASLAAEFEAELIADPGSLPAAVNAGASWCPDVEYVNWLGDDDLLEPESLRYTVDALDRDANAVVAFGSCRYIDEQDRELWISSAGRLAPWILSWGPDLIPQPGMLVRMSAWRAVAGVDASLRFAFDLDLLLKLKGQGTLVRVPHVVSCFRWHGDSLTVSDRTESLRESELARRRALGPLARKLCWIWEPPVRGATRLAAREVTRRAQRSSTRTDA